MWTLLKIIIGQRINQTIITHNLEIWVKILNVSQEDGAKAYPIKKISSCNCFYQGQNKKEKTEKYTN